MIIEWDEKKDLSNPRKHKISFDEAATVFDDSLLQLMTLIILRRSAAF